jgi:hypothetical protein
MNSSEWFKGYDFSGKHLVTHEWPWKEVNFETMEDRATKEALEIMAKADFMRKWVFPSKWIADTERKALKKFERSFELRHMFDRRFPRPSVLPVGSYGYDAERAARKHVSTATS